MRVDYLVSNGTKFIVYTKKIPSLLAFRNTVQKWQTDAKRMNNDLGCSYSLNVCDNIQLTVRHISSTDRRNNPTIN